MTAAKLNHSSLWWFFTPGGFETFENSKSAQAYELLSRHKHWLPLTGFVRDGGIEWGWDHSQRAPRMTWKELPDEAKNTFILRHRHALCRMGLSELVWISAVRREDVPSPLLRKCGPHALGAITLYSRDGLPSIMTGLRLRLKWIAHMAKKEIDGQVPTEKRAYSYFDNLLYQDGVGKMQIREKAEGVRVKQSVFRLSLREVLKSKKENPLPCMDTADGPEAVRIEVDWPTLMGAYIGVENIVASFKTFYESDPKLRDLLKKLRNRKRSTRPKTPSSPGRIALTCAILDCEEAGVDFNGILDPYLPIIDEEMPSSESLKELRKSYKELCSRAGFAKPPRNAKVGKTIAGTFGLTNPRLISPVNSLRE